MRFGSLFAGAGGFDLGLERAGMECAWQVEIDDRCQQVLSHVWPDVPKHRDVCDVGPDELAPVDLICGGFPCQDLSVAGRREGLVGERSGLFYEFMRIVDLLAPCWVLIENVPGLLSSRGGRDMGAVLGTLAELGYGYTYRVLDTQYVRSHSAPRGTPQRRKRVFIVGRSGGFCPPEVLLEPEGLPWDPAPRREAGEGVAGGVEGRTGGGSVAPHDVAPTFFASGAGIDRVASAGSEAEFIVMSSGQTNAEVTRDLPPTLNVNHDGAPIAFDTTQVTSRTNQTRIEPARECHTLSKDGHPPAIAFHPRQDPISSDTAGVEAKGPWAVAYAIQERATDPNPANGPDGAGFREAVAYTVEARRPQMTSVPRPRRLAPVECERLQGWPDDHTRCGMKDGEVIELADTPRYRMCGNGVSAPVAEWIGRRIIATHTEGQKP